MKGREEQREVIVAEYLRGDISLRDLARKHGIGHSTVGRWVKDVRRVGTGFDGGQVDLALEVKRLRKELRESELHTKLLDAMIEIAEEQYKIPIRKKSGPKQ
jgi:transposase